MRVEDGGWTDGRIDGWKDERTDRWVMDAADGKE